MKQIYYITFTGRYIMPNGRLSKKQISFSVKDTNTDFKDGGEIYHQKRRFHIDHVKFEKMEGCFR